MLVQIITENGQKKVIPLTADAGAGNPVGTIIPMYKKSSPSGYLYCDGSTFDQTKYPLLYAYLGSNILPDYREAAITGAEQNTTDTIATHDVFAEGEFKDDQLQDHIHTVNRQSSSGTAQYNSVIFTTTNAWRDGETNNVKTSSARAGDVTRGKRKAVYFYIKATSGLSENAQDNVVAQLNEERSYSTSEVNTGKKWIDGKPIYEKTVDCGALPNATSKSIDHNIVNLDKIIAVRGRSSDGTYFIPLPYISATSMANNVSINATNTQIVIGTGSDRRAYAATYVTLEYTKTAD